MEISELLQWIANSQKTGVLTLQRDRTTKRIGFGDGKVVSVESNDPAEHLGQYLLAYGKIDAESLKRAFSVQEKTGLRLGEILVEVNLLKEADLEDSLRIQAVEILYNLFLWSEEGSFTFDDEAEPLRAGLDLELSGIIMEGVYRYDEWKRYREVFPSDNVAIESAGAWEPASDEDRLLSRLIAQRKSIGEICYEFRTSKFNTYSRLYELYEKGAVRVSRQEAPSAPDAVTAPVAPGAAGAKVPDLHDLFDEAFAAVRERRYEQALPLLETVQRRGRDEGAAQDIIDKAERTYRDILITRFIDPHKIPKVTLPPKLLTEKKFSSAEGYLISRIDGTWDVASIIRISPIPESEALGIFKKFIDDNIIVLT